MISFTHMISESSFLATPNNYKVRTVEREEWDRYWPLVKNANLLQSWEYGDAKTEAEKCAPVRVLVEDDSGEPVAVSQILTRSWPLVGGVARLNRGPLLFGERAEQVSSNDILVKALRAIIMESRRRRWWRFYIAPELDRSDCIVQELENAGLRVRNKTPWGSARLSLAESEDILFSNLKAKWRNMLRKAQKSEMEIRCMCGDNDEIKPLVDCYVRMQNEKGFHGISSALLESLAKQKGPAWCFRQYLAGKPVGNNAFDDWSGRLVSIMHGDTSTYLIGYTNETGRKLNANYLLLWQAILDAKRSGCRWFDLGGINNSTPSGVARFKNGIQAEPYSLVGEFLH